MPEEENKDAVEIKDPAKLLAMYEEAKKDLVELRKKHKDLQAELAGVNEEATQMWKDKAILAEAKAALADQGINDVDRILKYVNLKDIEVDDDNNLVGLDEKVNDLKTDFPELFDAKRRAGRNSADITEKKAPVIEKTTSEMQADAIFGG